MEVFSNNYIVAPYRCTPLDYGAGGPDLQGGGCTELRRSSKVRDLSFFKMRDVRFLEGAGLTLAWECGLTLTLKRGALDFLKVRG